VVSGSSAGVLRQVNLANVSMLYLLAVLATAVPMVVAAVFASIVAFLTFDWFFVDPIHHFTVSDPEEWVSLLFFLVTAIVTACRRAPARPEAQRRERGPSSCTTSSGWWANKTSRTACGLSPNVCARSWVWRVAIEISQPHGAVVRVAP
jgi:K+-sensing histidine kinase KdpD